MLDFLPIGATVSDARGSLDAERVAVAPAANECVGSAIEHQRSQHAIVDDDRGAYAYRRHAERSPPACAGSRGLEAQATERHGGALGQAGSARVVQLAHAHAQRHLTQLRGWGRPPRTQVGDPSARCPGTSRRTMPSMIAPSGLGLSNGSIMVLVSVSSLESWPSGLVALSRGRRVRSGTAQPRPAGGTPRRRACRP